MAQFRKMLINQDGNHIKLNAAKTSLFSETLRRDV